MILISSMAGVIHASDCRQKGRVYKVVAPEIPSEDVDEFIRVRRMIACGVCLRKLVVRDE